MNDLLPPRLPDPGFLPPPGALPAIVTRVRQTRARRARTTASAAVLACALAVTAGLFDHVLGAGVVGDAGTSRTAARSAEPAPYGFRPRPPSPPPPPPEGAMPGLDDPPVPALQAAGPTVNQVRVGLIPTVEVIRETVLNQTWEPCARVRVTRYLRQETPDGRGCLRHWWLAEVGPLQGGVRFVVEYCALDTDQVVRGESPSIRVTAPSPAGFSWELAATGSEETLRAGECWLWTVDWNGAGSGYGRDAQVEYGYLAKGTYEVHVDVARPDEPHVVRFEGHPRRQTTLRIR